MTDYLVEATALLKNLNVGVTWNSTLIKLQVSCGILCKPFDIEKSSRGAGNMTEWIKLCSPIKKNRRVWCSAGNPNT